ncbi:DUF1761 domain-containing protein [Roseiterribacter gracilis]|uniref:DUF1761 domain-containing protein n=1 Tax=Roseiterribacter gracilis TaxID=2812848 RepID=A0A8S8XKM4_9PROT|nr:hypothetical protein TMPK1_39420 [Rhodospirillales bacterium TMPK1]
MGHPSLLAVLVAALATFVIGGPWYRFLGPLRDRNANTVEKKGHPAIVFGTAYVLSVIAAYALGALLGHAPSVGRGVHVGFMVGLLVVATSFGVNYAFDQRPLKTWAIDAGYHVLQFAAFGLVLGLFG